MLVKKILLFIALSVHCLTYAQGKLRGTVVDAESKKPLPFANIVLLQNNEFLKGTSANSKGEYLLEKVPGGNYELVISYLGYTSENRSIQLPDGVSKVDYIKLQKGVWLKEVVISKELESVYETHVLNCGRNRAYTDCFPKSNGSKVVLKEINELALSPPTKKKISINELTVYPNPSNGDRLFLEYNSEIKLDRTIDLKLFDALGKLLYQEQLAFNGNSLKLKLSTLSNAKAGNYLLRLVDQKNVLSKRIIISP